MISLSLSGSMFWCCAGNSSKVIPPSIQATAALFDQADALLIQTTPQLNCLQHWLTTTTTVFIAFQSNTTLTRLDTLELLAIGIEVASGLLVFVLDCCTLAERRIATEDPKTGQAIFTTLQNLLQNTTHRKVLHDCRGISDLLAAQDIQLTFVADTLQWSQELDTKTKQPNAPYSLQQVLALYGGRHEASEPSQEESILWLQRPVTLRMMDALSEHISDLYSLHDVLRRRSSQRHILLNSLEPLYLARLNEYRTFPMHELVRIVYFNRALFICENEKELQLLERHRHVKLFYIAASESILILAKNQGTLDDTKALILRKILDFHFNGNS